MKFSAKHLFATLGMLTVFAVAPTTALASGSVHLHVPGLSIDIHDNHRSHKRHRKYYKNRYYNDRRYEKRRYRYNRDRYYNKRRYNDNYYSNGGRYDRSYDRRYDRRYNNSYRRDNYRVEVCPIDGYSEYYNRNRNCYEHKGHYHCS